MTDWTPVGGDPAPGDPEAIRAVARLWGGTGTLTTDQASQLHGRASSLPTVWRDGDDATAYEALLQGPVPMLDALAAAHAASAAALLTYAQQLERAQQQALTVLATATAAVAALAVTRARVATHQAAGAAGGSTAGAPFGSAFVPHPGPMDLPQPQVDANLVAAGESAVAGAAVQAAQIASEVSQAARAATAVLTQSSGLLQTWHAGGGRTARTPAEGSMVGSARWTSRSITSDDQAASHPLIFPCTPAAAAAQWNLMDPALQAAYIKRNPDLVGNTDGIPTIDRDAANRLVLTAMQSELSGKLAALGPKPAPALLNPPPVPGPGGPDGPEAQFDRDHPVTDDSAPDKWEHDHDSMVNELIGLQHVRSRIDDGATPPAFLMGLTRTGTGQAIIASGDPDTAAHVATFVPGTGSNIGNVAGNMQRSDRMYVSAQHATAAGSQVSVITWVGYDAPQTISDATQASYADAARAPLAAFLVGLRVSHLGPRAHDTVIGHSYGATLISMAAAKGALDADDLIFVASPGADVPTSGDLALVGVARTDMPDHVYATATSADPVADTPGFIWPYDPTNDDFQARVFYSQAHPGFLRYRFSDHSSYWTPASASLAAFGQIIGGNGTQVLER